MRFYPYREAVVLLDLTVLKNMSRLVKYPQGTVLDGTMMHILFQGEAGVVVSRPGEHRLAGRLNPGDFLLRGIAVLTGGRAFHRHRAHRYRRTAAPAGRRGGLLQRRACFRLRTVPDFMRASAWQRPDNPTDSASASRRCSEACFSCAGGQALCRCGAARGCRQSRGCRRFPAVSRRPRSLQPADKQRRSRTPDGEKHEMPAVRPGFQALDRASVQADAGGYRQRHASALQGCGAAVLRSYYLPRIAFTARCPTVSTSPAVRARISSGSSQPSKRAAACASAKKWTPPRCSPAITSRCFVRRIVLPNPR